MLYSSAHASKPGDGARPCRWQAVPLATGAARAPGVDGSQVAEGPDAGTEALVAGMEDPVAA